MKKLMKKKISLLGKEFSVFAIVLVAMVTFATAALVPYISNTVTGEVAVNSPIEFEISLDGSTWDDNVDIGTIRGSDSFLFYTRLTNMATGAVSADNATLIVTNNNSASNVECAEFTIAGTTCAENSDGTATLTTGPIVLAGGASQDITFTVNTAVNIEPVGYIFTSQVPY